MALKRLIVDGFGQLELNQVAFPRDGRIEAQCALDDVDFADVEAENGMLLAVDRVNRKVKFPVDGSMPIALHYSTEHMYDERHKSLKDFKLEIGTFYPRMGFLSVGELFTTNCICFDDGEFADNDAVEAVDIKSAPLYGGISAVGAIKISKTAPTVGPKLLAVEKTTMPDGQFAFKFQVLSA
jgi:hypothetical protein